MLDTIQVNYQVTSNVNEADRWLRFLETQPLIACDFEVAIRYTSDELAYFQSIVDDESQPKLARIDARSKLQATALDHPSHTTLTHLSVAWSESNAYVFILDNVKITRRILYWLTHTEVKQVWHNLSFDARQIHYRTGLFPINYEDSQLAAKCILNHVETYKAKTGLKELAGHMFGDWGISADNFTLAQMYEPHVLKYAATDACACYWLWNSIQTYIKDSNANSTSNSLSS